MRLLSIQTCASLLVLVAIDKTKAMTPSSESLSPADGTIAGGGSNTVDRPIRQLDPTEEERNKEFKYELKDSIQSAVTADEQEQNSKKIWDEAKEIADEWIEYSRENGISAETKKMARAGYFELVEKYVNNSPQKMLYNRLCDAIGICYSLRSLQGLDSTDPEWKMYDAAIRKFQLEKFFTGEWRQRPISRLNTLKGELEDLVRYIPDEDEYKDLLTEARAMPHKYADAIRDRQELVNEKRSELEALLADKTNLASQNPEAIHRNCPTELYDLCIEVVEAIREA